jgi:hypothetical protein
VAKYLTIKEGRTPAESAPVFVSDDVELIEAVGRLVAERLADQPNRRRRRSAEPPATPPISLVPRRSSTEGKGERPR